MAIEMVAGPLVYPTPPLNNLGISLLWSQAHLGHRLTVYSEGRTASRKVLGLLVKRLHPVRLSPCIQIVQRKTRYRKSARNLQRQRQLLHLHLNVLQLVYHSLSNNLVTNNLARLDQCEVRSNPQRLLAQIAFRLESRKLGQTGRHILFLQFHRLGSLLMSTRDR